MVAPAVSLIGLVKDVLRAKLHAEAAPLAPLLHYEDVVLAGFSLTTAQNSPVKYAQVLAVVMAT
jgi:hypothetical protein